MNTSTELYYGINAKIPKISIQVEALLKSNIETIVILTRQFSETRIQEITEKFEANNGSVYTVIELPSVTSSGDDPEKNFDYTEYLEDANSAVKSAINEFGEDKVGVFLYTHHTPDLLYQSKEMDSIQKVPWFSYWGDMFDYYHWAAPYAEKVKLYTTTAYVEKPDQLEYHAWKVNEEYIAYLPYDPVGFQGFDAGWQAATLYDSCWIMALSVLEANSADPTEVAKIFPDIASNYTGIYGNYELDEEGDRCNFQVGLIKIIQDGSDYKYELCGVYDIKTSELETYANFP